MSNIITTQIEGISANELINSIVSQVRETIQPTQTQTPGPDKLLTRKELLEFLQISEVTLWKYEKAGKIQCYKIGAKNYYKKDEVLNSLISKI